MSDRPETLEQLSARMDALEKRVHKLDATAPAPVRPVVQTAAPQAAMGPASDLPSAEQVSGAFLLLGKSMLGIAGAYLLRAFAESGVLPRLLIAAVAIAYAIGWLAAAARLSTRMRFASALYAGTSALILAPMLWELTMRFHVLSAAAAAGVLAFFVAAATALDWKHERATDFGVTYGAAALTALALSIATHEMVAFLFLLLAMLAVCEYKSVRGSAPAIRMVVAAMADCAAWFLIVIYHNPASERGDYPALGMAALAAPALLLLAITVTAAVFRTTVLKRKIGVLEIVQSVIAFLLWVLNALFVLHLSAELVGVVCLLVAFACYGAAYALFRGLPERRNFHVFATWGAMLSVTGLFLSLSPGWAAVGLALASVAAALVAVRICCTTLECHGIVYIGAAALACGLLEYSYGALAGAIPPGAGGNVWLVTACAMGCYITARTHNIDRRPMLWLRLIPALLAAFAAAGLTTRGLVWLLSRLIALDAFHIAFVRTLILCAMALSLAFAGSLWRRLELKWIAYAALVLLAAKLVMEDLRHGHMGFIAGAIFLFALTLIGVPRLARPRQSVEPVSHAMTFVE
jgi:hypothetical protein